MRRWVQVLAVCAAAALGAAALAESRATVTRDPYDQVVGSATITGVNGGKAFDLRGLTVQRDSKTSVTLVRVTSSSTVKLFSDVTTAQPVDVATKLKAGGSHQPVPCV